MDVGFAKQSGLLASLSDADLRALLQCAQRSSFRKDDVVLRQGQHNATLYVVQAGTLHVHRQAKVRRVFLARLEVGAAFGEVSLFDPGVTSATVTAVTDGALLGIQREHLERFAQLRPTGAVQLLSVLLGQIAKRLRETDQRLVDSIMSGAR